MLEVRNLVKIYKTKNAADVKALDDVSIKFNDTGMVFLLGKSGSGKSTLLNVLGGLDKFDSGEIVIKGKSSKTFTEKDFDAYRNTYLGFIFQEYNILPEFTVQKNISLALELQGKKANKRDIDALLEQVDLQGFARRKPNQLSGGQKQRIAIARALVKDPKIIMADEPTGALDSNTGKQVFDTLKKLSEDKLVIVVSHDREFAELYADRIIEMKDGKVLSDVTKRKRPPKALSSGFKIVGKSMIHIEKSHRFTSDEAKFLNDVVQSSTSDIIISADPSVNTEIKRLAKIDNEGNSEFFDPTHAGDIIENFNGEKLKLIKGRLRHKDSFKMGASGLKTKKVRLAITILLSAISLAMFGLADTMASYNVARSNYDSLMSLNTEYVTIAKNHVEKRGSYYDRMAVNSNDVDLANLKEKFPDYEFTSQYELSDNIDLESFIADNKSTRDYLYEGNIDSAYEFTIDDLENYGFTLYGANSQLPSTVSQVAITKYHYEMFLKYGYNPYGYSASDDDDVKIAKPDDIIGKVVKVDDKEFSISGIIDTGFNIDKYQELSNADSSSVYSYNSPLAKLYANFATEIEYGFHNSLFLKPGTIDLLSENSTKGSNDYTTYLNNATYGNSYFGIANDDVLNYTVFLSDNKSTLNADEVIVSASMYYNEYGDYISEKFNVSAYDNGDEIIYNYNYEYYDTKEELMVDLRQDLIVEFEGLSMTATIKDYYTDSDNKFEYKIAGVYFDRLDPENYYRGVDSATYFKSVESAPKNLQHLFGKYVSVITKLSGDKDKDFELISYLSAYNATDDALVIKSQVSMTLENFLELIETLAQVFLYIGIAFAVFSALLLMNFISISISYKKQEIGILRALGAKGSDVYNIFLNESLIITFINYVVSLCLTFGGVFLINTLMKEKLGFYLTLLSFGLRQVILLAAVSLIVALIATFLPTFKVSRMKPIDAIHNRK